MNIMEQMFTCYLVYISMMAPGIWQSLEMHLPEFIWHLPVLLPTILMVMALSIFSLAAERCHGHMVKRRDHIYCKMMERESFLMLQAALQKVLKNPVWWQMLFGLILIKTTTKTSCFVMSGAVSTLLSIQKIHWKKDR